MDNSCWLEWVIPLSIQGHWFWMACKKELVASRTMLGDINVARLLMLSTACFVEAVGTNHFFSSTLSSAAGCSIQFQFKQREF